MDLNDALSNLYNQDTYDQSQGDHDMQVPLYVSDN